MEKNSLNNFICHLSWLEKLSPTHTHPLISICEFSKPYELLFFEFEFWPTPPLHDPPHPYMIHPTPSWPTPPHPFMTHPPHPTPPPPLVHFWAQRSLFSWAASLCLPLGRQIFVIGQSMFCNFAFLSYFVMGRAMKFYQLQKKEIYNLLQWNTTLCSCHEHDSHLAKLYSFCHNKNLPLPVEEKQWWLLSAKCNFACCLLVSV